MKCKKCGSENVNIQKVSEVKTKRRSTAYRVYWYTIGWVISLVTWLCFFLPRLIIRLIRGNKGKMVTKHKTLTVCQACGESWNID